MTLHWSLSSRVILTALTKALLFHVLYVIYTTLQSLWWRVSGVHQQLQAARTPDGYHQSAQVLKIITRCKWGSLQVPRLSEHILTHEKFVHPKTVLENDHIMLYFLTDDQAVFSVAEEGQMLWQMKYEVGMQGSIPLFTKKLIVMPLTSFNRLADGMDMPKSKLVCLGNTARCGSTLLTQLFEKTNKVVTFSEPYYLIQVHNLFRSKGMCDEVLTYTRRILKVMCKPLKLMPAPVAYFMKPTGGASSCMSPIKKLCPDSTLFYLYRNMEKTSQSMYKASFSFPSFRMLYFVSRISGRLSKKVFESMGFYEEHTNVTTQDCYTCGVLLAGHGSRIFGELREQNVEIYGILYDDFIADVELGTRAIFKICGFDESLLEPALRATKGDAQAGSIISRDTLAPFPALTFSQEDKVRGDAMLRRLKVPEFDSNGRMKGTINFKSILES